MREREREREAKESPTMDPSLLAEQQRRPRAAPTAEEYTNPLSMYQKRVAWSEEGRQTERAREEKERRREEKSDEERRRERKRGDARRR